MLLSLKIIDNPKLPLTAKECTKIITDSIEVLRNLLFCLSSLSLFTRSSSRLMNIVNSVMWSIK